MKKLLAIAVIFALVTGVAFAEANIGFTLDTRFDIRGTTASGNLPTMGGSIADAYLQGSATNDDGTMGGLVRIRANPHIMFNTTNTVDGTTAPHNHTTSGESQFHRAFIWWQPIDQLRIFLGKEKDGMFGSCQLSSWPYHRGAEGYLNFHDWGLWRGIFLGNWDTFGLAVSIFPVDGLTFNVVFATGNDAWPNDNDGRRAIAEQIIGYLQLTASFDIPDIGTVYAQWIGPGQNMETANNNGQFGFSFLFNMIDGLQVQAGMSTRLMKDGADMPMNFGLSAHYAADGWGVKTRNAFIIAPGVINTNRIHINVMPWVDLDALSIFCDVGFIVNLPEVGDSWVAWHFNPYVRVPIPGGRFQAGLKLNSDTRTVTDGVITYSIPMGLVFSF